MIDLDNFIYPSSFDDEKVFIDINNGIVHKRSTDIEYKHFKGGLNL